MRYARKALEDLKVWSERRNRKPLILRGARQVGKSTLVRMLAIEFEGFIELNFEDYAVRDIFEQRLDFNQVIERILIMGSGEAKEGRTLIFLDEIQISPEAIRMLRFFYERRPDLYVIAAGSLLEFSLKKVSSFPVGRVDYYFLNPLSFTEFLEWTGHSAVAATLSRLPFPEHLTDVLFEHYHKYLIIGGLPEIVAEYAENKSIAALQPIYLSIWQAYMDDVQKYGVSATEAAAVQYVLSVVPDQKDRIKFAQFADKTFKSREIGAAFKALDLARIIQLIYPVTSTEPPVQVDHRKSPRLQFLDTGLLNYTQEIQGELIKVKDFNDAYRGKIVHHMLAQELMTSYNDRAYKPHFWVREKANSSSEVDLVLRHGKYIFPVEVKSGLQGRLRSLHQFMDRTNHPYAIRFLRNNFSVERYTTLAGTPYFLMNLPYFLMGRIREYADYLVNNYQLEEE